MTVRRLTAEDAATYQALRLEGIAAFPLSFLQTREEAEASEPEELAKRLNSGAIYGLFDGGKLVGFAGLSQQPWAMARHRAHIGPFYVSVSHQGQGGAQELMDRMVADAETMGVRQLELWVWSGNTRAIAFYTKNGFAPVGVIAQAMIKDGRTHDDLFMVRQLDQPTPHAVPAKDGLRRLHPEDWMAFRDIRLDMLRRDPTAFGSTHADWAGKPRAEIKAWIAKMHLFAFVEGGRYLASAAWYPLPGATVRHRGTVIAVYTRPEARGRGLFRQVMAAVERDAKASGILQLELDVSADQDVAQSAYLAQGYAILGGSPRALCHDGVYSDKIMMLKRLDRDA
jgi:ribosomal protein S18 acetylase RimI-like enzyme